MLFIIENISSAFTVYWFTSCPIMTKKKIITHTNLLKPLKVLPEEGHGPIWPGGAQLDNAVLQQLLNVVFLHILLTLPQAPLLLTARTPRCHDDNHNPVPWPLTFVLQRVNGNKKKEEQEFIALLDNMDSLNMETYQKATWSWWEMDRQKM